MIIKKIMKYLFEKIEKESNLKESNYNLLFKRFCLFYPILKKNLILVLSLNVFKIFTIFYFLICFQIEGNFNIQKIYYILLLISLIISIYIAIEKCFIVFYIFCTLSSQDNYNVIEIRIKKLLLSRLHKLGRKLNSFFYFYNLIQIYISFVLFRENKLFIFNFLISLLYFFRIFLFVIRLQRISGKKIKNKHLFRILESTKCGEFISEYQFKYKKCVICLEDFKYRDKLIELECKGSHLFHHKCIKKWFYYKTFCPLCKN